MERVPASTSINAAVMLWWEMIRLIHSFIIQDWLSLFDRLDWARSTYRARDGRMEGPSMLQYAMHGWMMIHVDGLFG